MLSDFDRFIEWYSRIDENFRRYKNQNWRRGGEQHFRIQLEEFSADELQRAVETLQEWPDWGETKHRERAYAIRDFLMKEKFPDSVSSDQRCPICDNARYVSVCKVWKDDPSRKPTPQDPRPQMSVFADGKPFHIKSVSVPCGCRPAEGESFQLGRYQGRLLVLLSDVAREAVDREKSLSRSMNGQPLPESFTAYDLAMLRTLYDWVTAWNTFKGRDVRDAKVWEDSDIDSKVKVFEEACKDDREA